MIEKIIQRIEATGLNYKQFEQELGLPGSSISHWKKGDFKPSFDTIIKIADYFQISIDELIGRTVIKK